MKADLCLRAPRVRRLLVSSLASLAALVAPLVHAQSVPATQRLPAVEVTTPARLAQPLEDALPSTSVITRAEIERLQSQELVQLLSRQAGIEFAQAGGPGAQAAIFVRGANSSQVLVLVDGVRMNSALSGGPVLGGVALDTIERIEISRGNLAALYGSSAIGGVVQIFTRAPVGTAASASVEGGQGQTLNGAATAGWADEASRVSLSVASRRSQQFSAIDPSQVRTGPFVAGVNADLDANRNDSASFSAAHRTANGTRLAASYWRSRNVVDFDDTSDGPFATHTETSLQQSWQASARVPVWGPWTSELAVGQFSEDSENQVSVASFSAGRFSARNRQATWKNDVTLAPGWTGTLALEWLQQRGGATSYDPAFAGAYTAFERDVTSPWAGLQGAVGEQEFQFAVRYDGYSDTASATTGLAAWAWRFAPQWRAGLQVSNAFRAPSFNDLYFPGFGNPDLVPETSTSGEASLAWQGGAWRVRAAAYRTESRNLIAYDPSTFRVENIARARSTGLELTAAGQVGDWALGANASWVRPINQDTDERLARRAPWSINASAIYEAGRWRAGGELSYVGPRWDADINTFARVSLDPYVLVRLVGSVKITPQVSLTARVENLFDEKYQTISGYNPQPRTVLAGLVFAWP
jgi:vitamin B12 transporter